MLSHRILSVLLLLSVLLTIQVNCEDYVHDYDDDDYFINDKTDEIASEKLLNIQKVQYSTYNRSDTYLSSTSYNSKGMAPLYNITNMVIDLFVDDDEPIPRGYIVVKEKKFEVGPKVRDHEWGDLIKKYWAILLVVLIIVLVAVFMPIVGLCFCCCRCAGACGGRTQPFDKKGDTCRRFFFGLFLVACASAMVFGVVVAFVTNSYLQHGVENATTVARYGINDTTLYLRRTSIHIRHILVDNYNELKTDLEKILNDTGNVVIEKLANESKAIELVRLNNLVKNLNNIQNDLEIMKDETKNLRIRASQLSDGLRGVKRELLTQLSKCNTKDCKAVKEKYDIGRLDTNGIDYNQLPDMTNIINGVQELIRNADLAEAIAHSEEKLKQLSDSINSKIDSNKPSVENALAETGRSLHQVSDDISNVVEEFVGHAHNYGYPNLKKADDYLHKYGIYRYYAGLIISSVLLFVLLCLTFGLMCGVCGKRPDGYGDDCCNKGAGGRFLMCAVAVIFLTVSALLIIALALFLVGIFVRRGVCDPLSDPSRDQIFKEYIDPLIDLYELFPTKLKKSSHLKNSIVKPIRISEVISACHENKTIYSVLGLEKIYDVNDIQDYPNKYSIDAKINKFIENIKIPPQTLLTEDTKKSILELAESPLRDFDEYKFLDNLTKNITYYNLAGLADQLEETAKKIQTSSNSEIRVSLMNQALILRSFQKELVDPMIAGTDNMLAIARNLEKTLKNDAPNFHDAMMQTLKDIQQAETFFKEEATDFVKSIAETLLTGFKEQFTDYLNMVANETQYEIGQCGPISQVYNATLVGACKQVIDPFNGFWTGLVWCLALFFPTLILAVKLSTLYQKSDPYPGPLVESGPKNRKRNKKRDRRSERHAEYYEDASPSTGHHRDARYNDMAPKNWDGAPPRYQNPPVAPSAEYERPPPYYYPGAQSDHD
ncbi:prominin-like protein isoform X2 [Culicoides brevitarsis]|uniref:prominin-like protein isoform X2 n=1 Tax=Culicoides brevitarsis TaxID=469753 RepID=UPI00307BB203